MQPNLITFSDVQKYCELSSNMAEKKYNTCIWEAEEIDLQNAVGAYFYNDFLKHKADAIYQDLLNGKEYTPPGITFPVYFRGVRPMIAYYAYARIQTRQNQESTAFGQVTKHSEFSNPVPDKTIARNIESAMQTAKKFETEMLFYLNNNIQTYPVWRTAGKGSLNRNTSGLSITSVGGSDFGGNNSIPYNRDSRDPNQI